MILKLSYLAIVLLHCHQLCSAIDPSPHELLAKLLDVFTRLESNQRQTQSVWNREPIASETVGDLPRVKPIPAPPPAPALGSVEMPVAWPYPPAPNAAASSEFPLLERFLKTNGITTNVQNNQIQSNSVNQWQQQTVQQRNPVPTAAPIQWSVPQPIQFQTLHQQQPLQLEQPRLTQTQVAQPQQQQQQQQQQQLQTPIQQNSYIQWGVPQKNVAPLQPLQPLQPYSSIQPVQSMSSGNIPPPLDPNENFYVEHSSQTRGQPKHFSLNTVRVSDPQVVNSDKLNVSFIMPPNIRPLSLNFDTGEVQIDFGDEKGKEVKAIPTAQSTYNSQDLDRLFGRTTGQTLGQTASNTNANSQTNYKAANIQDSDDGDYIVVRHDMNKYTFDLPKGLAVGANAQDVGAGGKEATQVDKYDVSGQKQLRFTLGRVSG